MDEKVDISVYEVVGDPMCVASDDGQKVYKRLSASLKQGRKVRLSFRKVKMLTSAFLNTAIGQLYADFSQKQIRELVTVADMEQDDMALLKRVVETAEQYFKDPEQFNRTLHETSDET
ncbi:MAG: STAS-like domain-containing protein [Candidatus Dadabacteria bacterium]|nr:STAS-like domain-containing protein [Candidatus Dadabacteria bacterium]